MKKKVCIYVEEGDWKRVRIEALKAGVPAGELLMRPWVKVDKISEKVLPESPKVVKKMDGLPKEKKIDVLRDTGHFNPMPKDKWKVK